MQGTLTQPASEWTEALRTVAVNSAYNASRALSKWFKHGVRLTADGFESVPLSDLADAAGNPDEAVAAIHLPLSGDLTGDMLLAFPEKVALALVDVMIGAPPNTSTQFGELEQSCLQETGNIVASAFMNSLATWLNLQVMPLAPRFAHDLAAAVIQPLLVGQAAVSDEALLCKTEFEFDKRRMDWRLLLLPSGEAMATMRQQCESDRIRRNALQTIAINGAFEASRAMSKWLRRGVRLSTEGFVRVPLKEACPAYPADQTVVALHLALGDQMHGHTLMIIPKPTALQLVDILTGVEIGTTRDLDEMARSCLQETGNIISSAFVNSWAKWLEINTSPAAPVIRIDMPEAIFEAVLVEQAMAGDDVFMAKTEFSVGGQSLEWNYYLLPTPSSLRLIEASCS